MAAIALTKEYLYSSARNYAGIKGFLNVIVAP